jgi:hypothetical protein
VKRILLVLACAIATACGSSSTSPSTTTPTPTPTPTPTTFTLSGQITSAGGGGIVGASVSILDGPNAGKSTTTDGSGNYTLSGLTSAGFTVNVSASNFVTTAKGVTVVSNTTLNVALLPAQLFTQSGSGNNVFNMPTYISRIHIRGTFTGFCCSNFIVKIGSSLVVNDIIGPSENSTVSDGVYLTSGGTVQITDSSGVSWTFTEVR